MSEFSLHMNMAPPMEQYSRRGMICNIGKLKNGSHVKWRLAGGGEKQPPRDVPLGHLALIVGKARRRFVVRVVFLNHPVLRQLLDRAYEEYGHDSPGPLAILYDEFLFEDIVHSLGGRTSSNQFSCSFMAF
ncbi:auxin-induced protein 15A-like [Pyrus ussuriensis x Pyrus communis]|uniref:Auxin-induced protein 15A-like n=1 Tax=Pyrus ussuriensis x Pyrus communis TaxID=2448454 RepID=A0A5N5I5Y3_9ROSA|nr:auxin-induced protein 15A-like [Pyrus ussuriensis x Pyrus communis]